MISRLKKPSQTFLIFSSAFLLVVSFPKFNCGFAAWIALVPAFVAVQKTKSFHEAFVIFYLIGFVFFFLSIEWLRYVTYFGWIFVCFLYAFFFGIFWRVLTPFPEKSPVYCQLFDDSCFLGCLGVDTM